MEASALRYPGGIGLHGRSPLLRLQSDERLIALIRRGNQGAFEVIVSRYHARLLAFCRHLLGSKEDAEDVLQEVLAAAFNAIRADSRPINVRPWLYRIARNRSLNHLRRIQSIGVDSMDIHLSEHGASTADKVHDREQFLQLVGDIHELPETQRTALVLREMDALSYEQIAEAMETTVPSVKSLLVRARISLAEAAEARALRCEDVRVELAHVAEGLAKRPGPLARRHLRTCQRCSGFQGQLKRTNRELAALLPLAGPLVLLRKLLITHVGHSAAGTGTGATSAGATAAGVGGVGASFGGAGMLSAGAGAVAGKAAISIAAAAIVAAGAFDLTPNARHHLAPTHATAIADSAAPALPVAVPATRLAGIARPVVHHRVAIKLKQAAVVKHPVVSTPVKTTKTPVKAVTTPPGRVQTQTDPTVLTAPAQTGSDPTTVAAVPPPASTSTTPTDTTTTYTTTGVPPSTTPTSTSTTSSTTPSGSPPPSGSTGDPSSSGTSSSGTSSSGSGDPSSSSGSSGSGG